MDSEKIDEDLIQILQCPACRGEVAEVGDEIVCQGECRRRYPIRDGIPIMLIDEARLPESE